MKLKSSILKSMRCSLTLSSIKNKLCEITKLFKEFKFQQSLWLESINNDKISKNKIFPYLWIDSEKKIEFSHKYIDKLIDYCDQLLSRVERWTFEGSGLTIHLILQHVLVISNIAICKKSYYFLLLRYFNNNIF